MFVCLWVSVLFSVFGCCVCALFNVNSIISNSGSQAEWVGSSFMCIGKWCARYITSTCNDKMCDDSMRSTKSHIKFISAIIALTFTKLHLSTVIPRLLSMMWATVSALCISSVFVVVVLSALVGASFFFIHCMLYEQDTHCEWRAKINTK